jgi:hypothetical protein
MRSNGLTAADYAPLAELDSSVAADALLALRDAGVAAYAISPDSSASPSAEDEPGAPENGGRRLATVFADRTALVRARAVLHDLDPGAVAASDDPQVDEVAWQQIVSGFSATASEPEHDVAQRPADSTDSGADTGADTGSTANGPAGPHPLVSDDHEEPRGRPRDPRTDRTDPDEHFVPEPPPPPPRLDRVSRLAWSGVFGGPLVMLSSAMLGWAPPRWIVLFCVLGFVGGMLTLVVRMKDRPPRDGGPDDGAVV